ncbi:hypothetical protein KC356_g108 [Hortaea werneckii]|nr:hypothetical protein KC356_g108 [Hortaea werneckii]
MLSHRRHLLLGPSASVPDLAQQAGRGSKLTGKLKSTIAKAIQHRQMMLTRYPNLPSEKVECFTILRPRSTETRIGRPYPHDKQIVATPVKELKAAVEPNPQRGMPSFSFVVPNQRLPLWEEC